MNKESFSFVVYMLRACAQKWGKKPSEVYSLLSSGDCINSLLVKHYDILHTQGTDFIVQDITDFVKNRGIQI